MSYPVLGSLKTSVKAWGLSFEVTSQAIWTWIFFLDREFKVFEYDFILDFRIQWREWPWSSCLWNSYYRSAILRTSCGRSIKILQETSATTLIHFYIILPITSWFSLFCLLLQCVNPPVNKYVLSTRNIIVLSQLLYKGRSRPLISRNLDLTKDDKIIHTKEQLLRQGGVSWRPKLWMADKFCGSRT